MRAVIQRVSEARVEVANETVGQIGQGLLVLLGIDRDDEQHHADKLLHKILNYRVFADANGKMNLNLQQVGGALLVVSQFTLSANTHKGLRPSFTSAASPDKAQALYDFFIQRAEAEYTDVASGRFAADMSVQLVNDGPVTFVLDVG